MNFSTERILRLTRGARGRIMRAVPPSTTQNFNRNVISMTTSFTQASTYKRHDAIVVMPACLWADCEVFGRT